MNTPCESGAVFCLPDPEQAARWLCDNLFFTPAGPGAVRCGSCVVYLRSGNAAVPEELPAESYRTGPEHLALRTTDIAAALAYCRGRGLELVLNGEGWFVNPQVLGKGEYYFHIRTPFGVSIEISQPVEGAGPAGPCPIWGLDHLGVPCADLDAELKELADLGFSPLFPPVENRSEREGRVRCTMAAGNGLVLEVYQFLDRTPRASETPGRLWGARIGRTARTGSGMRFA